MRARCRAALAFGVAVLAIATTACGSAKAGETTADTTAHEVGPPAPTTIPDWVPPSLGVAGEDALLEVVRQDLFHRGLDFVVDERQGTVDLADGRIIALATVAEAAATSDPTTWPALVARSLDVLLAP